MFVTFSQGSAVVEQSKVKLASSESAKAAVLGVLRGNYVDDGTPRVDGVDIIEGVISKLRRGTDEFDRAALSTLPGAFITED